MAHKRHSFIAFYPSDWIAGTARMTRIHRSIYFDICCYNWDKAEPCPETMLPIMLGDVDGWEQIVEALIMNGNLVRTESGIANERALAEAKNAFELWKRKSEGGKRGAAKTNTPDSTPAKSPDSTPAKSPDRTDGESPDAEPEPEPEPEDKDKSLSVAAKAAPKKRGSRLPVDFEAPEEWFEWGREQGYSDGLMSRELAKMIDWSQNSDKGAKKDWLAAWRNWLRNNNPDLRPTSGTSQKIKSMSRNQLAG